MSNFSASYGTSQLRPEEVMREDGFLNSLNARITRLNELLRELGSVARDPQAALALEGRLEQITSRFYALQSTSGFNAKNHDEWVVAARQLEIDVTALEFDVERVYEIDIRGSRRNMWIAGGIGAALLLGIAIVAGRASR